MGNDLKAALIGLDTSHSVEFTKRLQAEDCPEGQKVSGIRIVSCMSFATPFQNEEGINNRKKQLEKWGVKVTENFNETVSDCDVVMIEINDPSLHLEYFKKCAELGKPIFLDKPLADNYKNGRQIYELAMKKNLKIFSASSLRFSPQLKKTMSEMPNPVFTNIYGPLGVAPKGSSIIWYGVHAFEMLEKAMGKGALKTFTIKDPSGVTVIIEYPDKRKGVVELREGAWVFGGSLSNQEKSCPFVADTSRMYYDLLIEIQGFFSSGKLPVDMEDTLEIMSLLYSSEISLQTGKPQIVEH